VSDRPLRIALGADDSTPLVDAIEAELRARGHGVTRFGKAAGQDEAWAETGRRVAQAVAQGEHEMGIVCCWTGTGVSIAANKVPGIRAALCGDAETARGARRWNDANVLALSLRLVSGDVAKEILDAWLTQQYAGTEATSLEVLSTLDAREPGSVS
jgi:ribose 5-phosphate isomerase B